MEILNRIEKEGQKKARRIKEEAEEQAERRLEQAKREIETWREGRLSEARQEIENERRLVLSRARARARQAVLRAKADVTRTLTERLSGELAQLREDSERYAAFLERCVEEAEEEIGSPLILEIDSRDRPIVDKLLQERGDHAVEERITTIGGLVATSREGDLLVDNRLETRIENLIHRRRPELSRALFGGE